MGTWLAEVLTPSEPGSMVRRAGTRPLTYLAGPGWLESLPDRQQGNCAFIAQSIPTPQGMGWTHKKSFHVFPFNKRGSLERRKAMLTSLTCRALTLPRCARGRGQGEPMNPPRALGHPPHPVTVIGLPKISFLTQNICLTTTALQKLLPTEGPQTSAETTS